MSYYSSKDFVNNEIPTLFNVQVFKSDGVVSDNVTTNILNVTSQALLPRLSTLTLSPEISDNSNRIATTSYTHSKLTNLVSNTITSTNLLTASNGFTVSSGTVSFPANSIPSTAVTGVFGRLGGAETNIIKLQNITSGNSIVGTITTNILSINYSTNNNSPIYVTATANFSIAITNVPTTSLNAHYRIEVFVSNKFYCTNITVNGNVISMTAVGGFSNIASQVNVNATGLIQQFIIFFTGAVIPSRVNTLLLSTW